jgi:hypothetical protein
MNLNVELKEQENTILNKTCKIDHIYFVISSGAIQQGVPTTVCRLSFSFN